MKVAESTMLNLISQGAYSDGTGAGGKQLVGLDLAVPVTPTTGTYGGIAMVLSSGPRAVGTACGRNPMVIVTPCHRVLASGGATQGATGPSVDGAADGPYCAGKVQPKLPGGGFGRARRPQLLAADRAEVQAYEDRYAACCETYRAAKEQWRMQAPWDGATAVSPAISLPPYMLLGTLPLRLPGDRRPQAQG